MIDDWLALSLSSDDVRTALTFGMPEDLRYRPAWIIWNYLQWHTLGAPEALGRPLIWELLRVATLVIGFVAAAAAVSARRAANGHNVIVRSLLVGGAVMAVVTIPAIAVDIARYGPQEPLMVGLLCASGALFAHTLRKAMDGRATHISAALSG